ncbi:MAG: hypothetical protein ACK4VZ_15245, partial [Paracoccaceae bacterium]
MALFALLNLDHWMLVSLMRPLLAEMGVSDGRAVAAAAVIGPAQVLGRVALMAAGPRMQTDTASMFTVLAMVAGPVFLLLSGGGLGLVFAFAAVQGAAMGIFTILKPLLISEVNGAADYAASAAAISMPAMASTALAPVLGTWILGAGGPLALIGTTLALALGALFVLFRQMPRDRR